MTFAVVLMAAFDMIATDRNLTRVGYAMADRLDRGIDEFTERQPAYDDYEDADSPF